MTDQTGGLIRILPMCHGKDFGLHPKSSDVPCKSFEQEENIEFAF